MCSSNNSFATPAAATELDCVMPAFVVVRLARCTCAPLSNRVALSDWYHNVIRSTLCCGVAHKHFEIRTNCEHHRRRAESSIRPLQMIVKTTQRQQNVSGGTIEISRARNARPHFKIFSFRQRHRHKHTRTLLHLVPCACVCLAWVPKYVQGQAQLATKQPGGQTGSQTTITVCSRECVHSSTRMHSVGTCIPYSSSQHASRKIRSECLCCELVHRLL